MKISRCAARDYHALQAGGHVIHCHTLILMSAPVAGEEKIPTTPGGAARPGTGAVMQFT